MQKWSWIAVIGSIVWAAFGATYLVNAGKAVVTGRIKAAGIAEPTYIGWGTGGGSAVESATGLTTPSAEARTNGTSTQQTTTVTNDTYQVVGTVVSASQQDIDEAALFTASTSGTMFILGDFTAIPLEIGDSIQFTFKIKFTSA